MEIQHEEEQEETNSNFIAHNRHTLTKEYSLDSNSSFNSNKSSQSAYLEGNHCGFPKAQNSGHNSNQLHPFISSLSDSIPNDDYNQTQSFKSNFSFDEYKNYRKASSHPVSSFSSSSQLITNNQFIYHPFYSSYQYDNNNNNNQYKFKQTSTQFNPQINFKKTQKKTKSNHHKTKGIENPKNKIHLENILRQKEKRTTLMIRNIPNKFVLKQFIEEINMNFRSQYDLIYLPIDRDNKCNLGYAFINFLDPMIVISFYDSFNGRKWTRYNSDKRCELAYAKIQGKEELLKYINKSFTEEIKNAYITETKITTNLELPLRYFQAFKNFYPYSSCKIVNYDKFIVDSYYNF